jgi:cytochrome c oxidase subunit 4
MTTHTPHATPTDHAAHDATTHHKPGEGLYFAVFILLAVLTMIELLATYLPDLAKIPLLLGLATAKAFLVVQFYMHLRYEHKILTWSFLIPVVVGLIALLVLQPLVGPLG